MKLHLPNTNERLTKLFALGLPNLGQVDMVPLEAIESVPYNGLDEVHARRKAEHKAQAKKK